MIRLGILGCSEIAFRRFMPAIKKMNDIEVVAVAEEYAPEKTREFCNVYAIEEAESFLEIIHRDDIDAVYIPQPPALHYKWAKYALENNKHVLVEKPATLSLDEAVELVELARARKLALHENYMFQYHRQINEIKKIIDSGKIGEVRLYRADFGFPIRKSGDFRYNKDLGGGAFYDAGGYIIKLATLFLGESIKVKTAAASYLEGYEVDMYGSITLSNNTGHIFQASYGMDNAYKCSLNIWGNKGTLQTDRIFTAPPDYEPEIEVNTSDGEEIIKVSRDTHFIHSIEQFCKEINCNTTRQSMYRQILLQARLMDEVRHESGI